MSESRIAKKLQAIDVYALIYQNRTEQTLCGACSLSLGIPLIYHSNYIGDLALAGLMRWRVQCVQESAYNLPDAD